MIRVRTLLIIGENFSPGAEFSVDRGRENMTWPLDPFTSDAGSKLGGRLEEAKSSGRRGIKCTTSEQMAHFCGWTFRDDAHSLHPLGYSARFWFLKLATTQHCDPKKEPHLM